MTIILAIITTIAMIFFIDAKQQRESGVATESTGKTQAIAVVVIVAAILIALCSGFCSSGSGSSSKWDSMSDQEKKNAEYAYEVGKWMDSNGYS